MINQSRFPLSPAHDGQVPNLTGFREKGHPHRQSMSQRILLSFRSSLSYRSHRCCSDSEELLIQSLILRLRLARSLTVRNETYTEYEDGHILTHGRSTS